VIYTLVAIFSIDGLGKLLFSFPCDLFLPLVLSALHDAPVPHGDFSSSLDFLPILFRPGSARDGSPPFLFSPFFKSLGCRACGLNCFLLPFFSLYSVAASSRTMGTTLIFFHGILFFSDHIPFMCREAHFFFSGALPTCASLLSDPGGLAFSSAMIFFCFSPAYRPCSKRCSTPLLTALTKLSPPVPWCIACLEKFSKFCSVGCEVVFNHFSELYLPFFSRSIVVLFNFDCLERYCRENNCTLLHFQVLGFCDCSLLVFFIFPFP